ncbi:MAG: hypothetical protein RBS39_05795 [Phycisphaerales bacterium]|jgi:hypothetical protein|nr:hypothetical protein [Phycisphaerales bacterium]
MRIVCLTCRNIPEPDVDEGPLLAALRERGADASMLAWEDAAALLDQRGADAWAPDLVVIRSTWNYHHDLPAFLAAVDALAARTRVLNAPEVVRTNAHKRYLAELDRAGVPVVPTEFIERGAPRASLAELCARRGWDDVVVKPAVSAGSFATRRFRTGAFDDGEAFLREVLTRRDALVQAYMASVEGSGERSVMWIDGAFTHAIRKSPRFAGQDESVSDALPIASDEMEVARRVLGAAIPGVAIDRPCDAGVLYARIDLMRDERGTPLLSELELIEPSLFLEQHPPARARLADAMVRLARQ